MSGFGNDYDDDYWRAIRRYSVSSRIKKAARKQKNVMVLNRLLIFIFYVFLVIGFALLIKTYSPDIKEFFTGINNIAKRNTIEH